MNDEQRPSQSLVRTDHRGLVARSSTLVRRGLEALRVQQPRIIHFPPDRSLGWLEVRDQSSFSEYDWEDFGEAQGEIRVPEGKQLSLRFMDELLTDPSPLAVFRPDDLWELWLTHREIRDTDLASIRKLTGLRSLDLTDTDVSDASLMHLQELTALQWLRLWYTQISDAGLAHLRTLRRLQVLLIGSTEIGDTGLEHLSEMTTLQVLDLSNTQISDTGLTHIKKLARLSKLFLYGTKISDVGLLHLQELRGLQELALSDIYGLSKTQITEAGVANLQQALPHCRISV